MTITDRFTPKQKEAKKLLAENKDIYIPLHLTKVIEVYQKLEKKGYCVLVVEDNTMRVKSDKH